MIGRGRTVGRGGGRADDRADGRTGGRCRAPWSRAAWPVVLFMTAALAAGACGSDGEQAADPGSGTAGGTEALTARTLGTAYLEDGRLEAAEEQFRRLVELAPESPAGYASLARVALQRGDPAAALDWGRQALDRSPAEAGGELRLLMATARAAAGDTAEARSSLQELVDGDVGRRALWELSRLSPGDRTALLRELVESSPENVAARLELAQAELEEGRAGEAAAELEELRQVAPAFPSDAVAGFEGALEAAREGRGEAALEELGAFRRRYELTTAYQAALNDLRGPRGVRPGTMELSFARGVAGRAAGEALHLRPATGTVGLSEAAPGVLAAGDVTGDGSPDLVVGGRIYRNGGGRFVEASGLPSDAVPGEVRSAAVADLDNDGRLDLVLAGRERVSLIRSAEGGPAGEAAGDGSAGRVTGLPVPDGTAPGDVQVLDLDQDGDLDVFVAAGGRNLAYRNDGDGTYTELAGEMGLAADGAGSRPDALFLDVDGDGYLDLVATGPGGSIHLYRNRGHGRFDAREIEAAASDGRAGVSLAAGDVDHDGAPELVVARDGRTPVLLENDGTGSFRRSGSVAPGEGDSSAGGGAGGPVSDPARAPAALRLADLDNDGRLDLIRVGPAAATGAGADRRQLEVFFGRADGGFRRAPEVVDGSVPAGTDRLAVADFDDDGDLDLVVAGSGGLAYLRNDGGNANHFLRLRLVGLRDGSGKNNHFGIGARVEVRAGDLYQTRTVQEPVTHIGLADRSRADVVRIVWPNGVPQVRYEASAGTAAAEDQELKGSCAFLYAWDGEGYEMVTDVMWRSALGMPLGIMSGPGAPEDARSGPGSGGAGAPASPARYAPPGASLEYVRIPPGALRERDGAYSLRLTEELWEVAYVDELRLVAVDHPDTAELFVNEAFRPPGPPNDELHPVSARRPPAAAWDGEGEDVLPELRASDDVHVADLTPTRYQGVTEPHEIVLRAPETEVGERIRLFLRGWVFPTDASINVAIGQNPRMSVVPPYLQVPDGEGGWRTVMPDLGFPSGKEKTVIADLTGLLPAEDPRVRIRTSMEVYWDEASFAVARPDVELRRTAAHPHRAELAYRGFSREYRKGGRHGPHWFDYDSVSQEPRWGRAITGRYTRYGDVRELLTAADSRSVVMAPGDEIELSFPSDAFPELPAGWSRTFLLYSNGWIKDADLNTRTGHTVEPMPHHGLSAYPPPPGERFPRDSADRAYLEEYQTRVVEPRPSPLSVDGG